MGLGLHKIPPLSLEIRRTQAELKVLEGMVLYYFSEMEEQDEEDA